MTFDFRVLGRIVGVCTKDHKAASWHYYIIINFPSKFFWSCSLCTLSIVVHSLRARKPHPDTKASEMSVSLNLTWKIDIRTKVTKEMFINDFRF